MTKNRTCNSENIIDCDTDPFVPDDWEVVEHQKGAKLECDPSKVELYLCDEQKWGLIHGYSDKEKSGSIRGYDLRKKLEGKPALNAKVLDYLLEHPELIPEDWKRLYIFFWGTIYRNKSGHLCVRYLFWDGDRWKWHDEWLEFEWGGKFPAALRK